MTIISIKPEQKTAARIAGLTLILPFIVVAFAEFAIFERFIVSGDAAQTAQNILAHLTLFRFGIACDVLYVVGNVILLAALYLVLKPVSAGLTLVATFFRLVHAAMWLMIVLEYFKALQYLGHTGYLSVFSAAQLQAMAKFSLAAAFDTYYVGLLFYSLASTICGVLWFKSGFFPRILAVYGVLASAWAVVCTLALYVYPDFDKVVNLWWFDTPMGLFDIATGFWLLLRGIRVPVQEGAATQSA